MTDGIKQEVREVTSEDLYTLLDDWVLRLDFVKIKMYNTIRKNRTENWMYYNKQANLY